MSNLKPFVFLLITECIVDAVPVVFKESTPNGEAIVSISSSDPNVEKYLSQQFSTRSGFTEIDSGDSYSNHPGNIHSSVTIAVPGKAVAGNGRSIASASSGPFFPLFAFPINSDFDFNSFPDLKDWIRNLESHYDHNFPGNRKVYTVTAINENGHVYAKVNTLTFDDRAKNPATYSKTIRSKL